MMKMRLINYFDVWGNKKDGYEVNNLCEEGIIEVASWSDSDVLKALKKSNFIKKHVRTNMLTFSHLGPDCVEIEHRSSYRPICRLEFVQREA